MKHSELSNRQAFIALLICLSTLTVVSLLRFWQEGDAKGLFLVLLLCWMNLMTSKNRPKDGYLLAIRYLLIGVIGLICLTFIIYRLFF